MTQPKPLSPKQLAANRANAQKSTGPRTPEGKAISSQNAVKHGILSRAVIPRALEPYESRVDFDSFLSALREVFVPQDLVDELLVQQIGAAYWRLSRLYRAEAGDIALRHQPSRYILRPMPLLEGLLPLNPNSPDGLRRQHDALSALIDDPDALRAELLSRDPTLQTATDAQLLDMVRARLAQIEAQLAEHERHDRELQDALTSLPDIDTALKFARYECALQRQLSAAYARLERRQRQRNGDQILPPIELILSGDLLERDESD